MHLKCAMGNGLSKRSKPQVSALLALAALSLPWLGTSCGSSGSSTPGPKFSNASLVGNYSYGFSGNYFTSTGTEAYQEAGTFVADGKGNLTGGKDDFMQNSALSSSLLGGTYSINQDGTGTITFNLARGRIQLAIAMSSSSSVDLIEFDSFANGAGVALRQDTSAFSAPNGSFVFHLDSSQPGAAVSGSFSRVGSMNVLEGAINGREDFEQSGLPGSSMVTGSITAPDANGRGTATLTEATSVTSNYVYYVIDSTTLKFLEIDGGLLGSGRADAQSTGPFSNASLNGGFEFNYSGNTVAAGGANVAGAFTCDGKGNIVSGSYDIVQGESPVSNAPLTGTYSVESNGRATITLIPTGASPIPLIVWIESSSKGLFVVDLPNAVQSGRMEQQQGGPFSAASLKGSYSFYTAGYDSQTSQNIVRTGVVSFDGSTNVTFTDYFVNRGNGKPVQNGAVSGTYTADANGRIVAFSIGEVNTQIIYLSSGTSGDLLLGATGVGFAGTLVQQTSPD